MKNPQGTLTLLSFINDKLAGRQRPAFLSQYEKLSKLRRGELLLAQSRARYVETGRIPYYDRSSDHINLPSYISVRLTTLFFGRQKYLINLFHELTHWTGHGSRLSRSFGDPEAIDQAYCREELVAELGAALLYFDLSIGKTPLLPNAQYLNHFLSALPHPGVELNCALSRANQATAYLLALLRNHGDSV